MLRKMKEKIFMLIVGILIGAIITAGCFMLFSSTPKGGNFPEGDRKGGRPDMENGIPEGMPNERENMNQTVTTNEAT